MDNRPVTTPARVPAPIQIDNSLPKLGLRMFGATLYATAFCCVCLIFSSFLINEGAWGAILYQVCNLVIYTPIIYMTAWKYGSREQNYVQFGHMEEDLWRGFKFGSLAIIPYSLCLIVMLFSKLGIFADLLWLVRIIYAPFVVLFNLMVPNQIAPDVAATVANASYLGILGAALLQLYVPIVTGIAYRLGYREISLYHKLVYKNGKPPKKA